MKNPHFIVKELTDEEEVELAFGEVGVKVGLPMRREMHRTPPAPVVVTEPYPAYDVSDIIREPYDGSDFSLVAAQALESLKIAVDNHKKMGGCLEKAVAGPMSRIGSGIRDAQDVANDTLISLVRAMNTLKECLTGPIPDKPQVGEKLSKVTKEDIERTEAFIRRDR